MELEQRMIIRFNGQVELKPTELEPKKVHIDHRKSLALLGDVITECEDNVKPRIIGIEGEPGSGKSILAFLLAESGANTVLIHAPTNYNNPSKIGLPPMGDPTQTFIFDEPNYVTDASLDNYTAMIADKNGIGVFLCQKLSDLPTSVTDAMVTLKLTREGLTRTA